jgi:hypothetical protein
MARSGRLLGSRASAAGHPGTYPGSTTAFTSGRGDQWRAEITDRGRAYLANSGARPPRRRIGSADGLKLLSKTERLVADVIAAGGRLSLPDETAVGGVNWRQRAYAAQRHGKVPAGKHLAVSRSGGMFMISLEEGVTGNELGADEVPVPARVARYHPVAQAFRRRTELHEVSRKALPRASRIVHALAVELDRRSYKIECVAVERDSYGRPSWNSKHDGQLIVTINGHPNRIRLWEKGAGLRGVWESQTEHWQRERLSPRLGLYLSRPGPTTPMRPGS